MNTSPKTYQESSVEAALGGNEPAAYPSLSEQYLAVYAETCIQACFHPVGQLMLSSGWDIESTGGGYLAWSRELSDGRYIWITDEDAGLGIDNEDHQFLVGLYEDGDQIEADQMPSIEAAIASAEDMAGDNLDGHLYFVHMTRMVEETCLVRVIANTIEDAQEKAIAHLCDGSPAPEWHAGDECSDVEVYGVVEASTGDLVWER